MTPAQFSYYTGNRVAPGTGISPTIMVRIISLAFFLFRVFLAFQGVGFVCEHYNVTQTTFLFVFLNNLVKKRAVKKDESLISTKSRANASGKSFQTGLKAKSC